MGPPAKWLSGVKPDRGFESLPPRQNKDENAMKIGVLFLTPLNNRTASKNEKTPNLSMGVVSQDKRPEKQYFSSYPLIGYCI